MGHDLVLAADGIGMSAHRFHPFAFCACLLAVLGAVAPLGAQTSVAQTYDEAIDTITLELAYRQYLGAFESPSPQELRDLPTLQGIDSLAVDVAAAELEEIDTVRGPAALQALVQHDAVVTPPVNDVLSAGAPRAPSGLDYLPYVRSYSDLVLARVALEGRTLDAIDDPFNLFGLLPAGSIDRGSPPDVLIHGDTERGDFNPEAVEPSAAPALGRFMAEPRAQLDDVPDAATESSAPSTAVGGSEGFPFSPDPTELLILAAVGVILLGLLTMLATSGQRQASGEQEAAGPSSQEFLKASRAIHAAESVESLCRAAAESARSITGANSAIVTIDGLEGKAGESFDVPTELVFRANREVRLVSRSATHAMPVSAGGTVVGLLVIDGGQRATLEAFAPLVEDGYESVCARERTAALAFVDGLTGIANRRRFDNDLDHAMGLASSTETPVAVAMFDVDHFKTFNDSNGHQAGDDVLRAVAALIASNVRATDVVYRYGGEEFIALLPAATVEDAYEVVDRIRRIVESTPFDGESSQPAGTVTLSVGVAAARTGDVSTLVHAADMALYGAKTAGRNRVVIEAPLT